MKTTLHHERLECRFALSAVMIGTHAPSSSSAFHKGKHGLGLVQPHHLAIVQNCLWRGTKQLGLVSVNAITPINTVPIK